MRAGRLVVSLAFLTVYGCTTLGVPPTPVPGGGAGTSVPPGTDESPQTTTATESLLIAGRAARGAGDLDAATAYIEQALRIAPNDPVLWIELGEIKLAEGDTAQAEAMGRKALTLTRGDRALEEAARRLIAETSS